MSILPQEPAAGKVCSTCHTLKPFSEFYEVKAAPGKYHPQCKVCNRQRRKQQYQATDRDVINAYARRHYAEHKDAHRENLRRYRQQHPGANSRDVQRYRDQKRQNGGSHTCEEWIALCEHYNNCCVACGAKGPLIADHIVPIVKGGSDSIENIQPLCASCNSRKHKHVIDYRS